MRNKLPFKLPQNTSGNYSDAGSYIEIFTFAMDPESAQHVDKDQRKREILLEQVRLLRSTGKLYPLVEDGFGTHNLQVIQGGAEVAFEVNQLIDHPGWQKAFLQYCRLTTAPKDVVARDNQTGTEGADGAHAGAGRLAAYAFSKTHNPAFVARAVSALRIGGGFRGSSGSPYATRHVDGSNALNPIDEAPYVSTNNAAQSSLTAIQVLELCKGQLPSELPSPGA